MNANQLLRVSVELAVVALVVAVVVGAVTGSPVGVGYVETGSMAPAIDAGDGFLAVPTPLAGQITPGDVVVFRASVFDGDGDGTPGGLTTHRVVAVTPVGLVTKGDANPFTDQSGGEPPVARSQVVAVVLTVGDAPVTVPGLGVAVDTVRGAVTAGLGAVGLQSVGASAVAVVVLVGSVGLYLDSVRREHARRGRGRTRGRAGATATSRQHGRRRDVWDPRVPVLALAVVVVVATVAGTVLPSGPRPLAVAGGVDGPVAYEYETGNTGFVPVVAVLTPGAGVSVDGAREDGRALLAVPGRGAASTALSATPPDAPGTHRLTVVEHRYYPVVPSGVVLALHAVHPVAPTLLVSGLFGAATYLLGVLVVGTGPVRRRTGTGSARPRV
jgi:signal peptidase